jgi:hypothetical protein
VSQKLGAPIVSQPNTGVFRKNSAGSTQSDSKIMVSNKAKSTQKVAPKEDLFKPAQQQRLSAPKDGSDRQINRNLPLTKTHGSGFFTTK